MRGDLRVILREVGELFEYVSQAVEVEIDGRTFWLRPVGREVLNAPNAMAAGIAESMGKPQGWGVGFMFGNLALAAELWITIAGVSGLDDE